MAELSQADLQREADLRRGSPVMMLGRLARVWIALVIESMRMLLEWNS